jgi:AcrR family transcriptional regulator
MYRIHPRIEALTAVTELKEHARTARRDATRERVLDAAREVFAEKGVFGGSVEEICERAGFTRGAFYSNFTDKDDVLRALVEREQSRLLEHLDASLGAVDEAIEAASDLASVLHSIIENILRSVPIDRHLMLMTSELETYAIRRPDVPRHLLDVNAKFRGRIGGYIESAMHRHGRELIVPAADVTDTLFAVVERSYRRALLGGEGADPDALASAVLPGILLAFSRVAE